jgi:hypothetical protein
MSAQGTLRVNGECPLNVSIEIDDTAFGRGSAVAGQVTTAVLNVASTTIRQGGALRVALFARDATRDVLIYQGQVPTLATMNELERQGAEQSIESGIRSVVMAAFDPNAPRTPAIASALAPLGDLGSDIARAVGVAVRTSRANAGAPSAAVAITDGNNNAPGLRFHDVNASGLAPRATTQGAQAEEGPAAVNLLAMIGIGQVPQQYETRSSSHTTAALVAIWEHVCHGLRIPHCVINPEL